MGRDKLVLVYCIYRAAILHIVLLSYFGNVLFNILYHLRGGGGKRIGRNHPFLVNSDSEMYRNVSFFLSVFYETFRVKQQHSVQTLFAALKINHRLQYMYINVGKRMDIGRTCVPRPHAGCRDIFIFIFKE